MTVEVELGVRGIGQTAAPGRAVGVTFARLAAGAAIASALAGCAVLGLDQLALKEVQCDPSDPAVVPTTCWIGVDDRGPNDSAVIRALTDWGAAHGASDVRIDMGTCMDDFDTAPRDDVDCEVQIVDGSTRAVVGRVSVSFSPSNSTEYSYKVRPEAS